MAKIKYTKNELKAQKENLKRFTRYLPTLELKKKQLLVEIRTVQKKINQLQSEIEKIENQVSHWVDVFAEDIDLNNFFNIKEVIKDQDNIAGIDIPVFQRVGLAVAVADACEEARAAADKTTEAAGGQGAVRELVEWLLKEQGRWEEVIRHYGD